jgi:uncharacterized membrane protein
VRPAAAGDSTTGLPTRTASVLAYLGWWVTGALMLLLERRDKTVRFHAAQSVVALGAVWLLGVVVYGLAFGLLSIGARGFVSVLWLAFAIWAAGVVLWAVCLMQVIRGEQWRIPLAATVAERLA